MAGWFNDIQHNEYSRANQSLAEQLRAIDMNPNEEVQAAELDWLRNLLESTPRTNIIFRRLLSGQMKQLMHSMSAKDDDRTKRAAKAVAECDKNLNASWRETTDLMDRASINAGYTSGTSRQAGTAGWAGSGADWAIPGTPGGYDPSKAQSGSFNIPGRVNEVTKWNLGQPYQYSDRKSVV